MLNFQVRCAKPAVELLENAKLQVLVCLQLDMGDLRYGKIYRSLMIWNRHSHSKLLAKRVEHMGDEHNILEADFSVACSRCNRRPSRARAGLMLQRVA